MQPSFSICFNKPGNNQLPCDINNQQALTIFRQDNPHVIANFIPNGTPFIIRNDTAGAALATSSNTTWRQQHPDLAARFKELLSLPYEQRINIANMLNQYGSDMLTALAEFHEAEIKPMNMGSQFDPREPRNQNGYAGALVGIADNRLSNFAALANKYQQSLENIRRGSLNKLPKFEMLKLEQLAKNLNVQLNTKFKAEVAKYFSKAGARGNAWTSAQRGIGLAKGARNYQPIQLTSSRGFSYIKNLASKARSTGYIGLVVDAGFRASDVHDQYKAGEYWQKSAAIETTAFASSAIVGLKFGGSAIAITGFALGVTLAATPIGWVIIIGAGLAAGYAGAVVGNALGKTIATELYDVSDRFLSL